MPLSSPKPSGEPTVVETARHVDGRGKGSLQHEAPDRVFGCQHDRERGAQRFSQEARSTCVTSFDHLVGDSQQFNWNC